jgi:hypothetical protein
MRKTGERHYVRRLVTVLMVMERVNEKGQRMGNGEIMRDQGGVTRTRPEFVLVRSYMSLHKT